MSIRGELAAPSAEYVDSTVSALGSVAAQSECLRVTFFELDPGGGTIFVRPLGNQENGSPALPTAPAEITVELPPMSLPVAAAS